MNNTIKKRTVKFKDKEKNVVVVELEITNRNGYPEFTASGEYGGGCGQCQDSIKPKNEHQEKLLTIWEEWHLNKMSSGTPEQDDILREYRKSNPDKPNPKNASNYELACEILKVAGKFEVKHPKTNAAVPGMDNIKK